MPPPRQVPTPLGPQIGIETADLGSNDPHFSLTLEQLTNRCNLIQRVASQEYAEARPWLERHANALLPTELNEIIPRFPPLAAKASMVVMALPPERQMEFLRSLLPPATLAAAAQKPDAFTIATMVHAIVEGGRSDPALQARMSAALMTEGACETMAAEGTVRQLADAARAVSLQEDAATKGSLMETLLLPANPEPAPLDFASNAYLVECAMLLRNEKGRSAVVHRYLSDETCIAAGGQGGHSEIGVIAYAACYLEDSERLSQIADRLFSDRALDTLVDAVVRELPRSQHAIGRAAKLVDALPNGDLKTALAERIATPGVCDALESSGDLRAIGRMAMASVAVSNLDQRTKAMGALASRHTCDKLIAHPDPVAIGQLLFASAHWHKEEGSQGRTAIESLLQGASLEALRSWPHPIDTFKALPAAALLPDPDQRHATLAQLMRPEIIAAIPNDYVDLTAWAAHHAQQMQPGTERDATLGALLTTTSCKTALNTLGVTEIQAIKDAAALLPEGAQRQQVLAIMNGQPVPQWEALMAGHQAPTAASAARAAGGPSL